MAYWEHPRLRDLPVQIETTRLILRPPQMGDGAMVNDAIRETFPSLNRWMAWARSMPPIPETETVMREAAARYRTKEELSFLIFQRQSGLYTGSVSLHHIDWEVPKFEIGYWIRASEEGNGFMTEAVSRLTEYCFAHWDALRMEIRCDARNTRSAAVAQRAGYTLEATLRWDARDNQGNLRDTLIFSKFAPQPFQIA